MIVNPTERIRILGSPVSAVSMQQVCDSVMDGLAHRRKGYVCLAGIQTLSVAYEDPDFREVLERAFLVTPDGMPLVWLGKLLGQKHMTRVYGPDLMLNVCRLTVASGHTHFLYGGHPGVADVHHLHIWPVSTTETVLTAHLHMPGGHPGDAELRAMEVMLHDGFGVDHATLQIETGAQLSCVGCN